MEIGFVGLGRMGGNMVHRLRRDGGHEVVAYDPDARARAAAEEHGAVACGSLEELAGRLAAPRAVWMMVPAGRVTEQTFQSLLELLSPGDAVVDGGNSNYHETVARGERAEGRGLGLVDAGTSGGVWGLEVGYCLMVGGDPGHVARLEPVFVTLAPEGGYLHVGPTGAGHFVKMIHNGIEYGMLEAYAEGFDLLNSSDRFEIDLPAVARLWNRGSVVRSWLLELAERAFADDPKLSRIAGWVEDSGEGRWTVEEALDQSVPAPVLALSLMARYRSRRPDAFSDKVIAALRNEFGGHAVRPEQP